MNYMLISMHCNCIFVSVKKVLIISYYFPPANFVGSERTAAWMKYLPKNGFYPIVVTRCWNDGQKDIIGDVSNNQYSIEKMDKGEIHYVPLPFDWRNRLKGPLRKLITLKRLLSRSSHEASYEFKSIHERCREILKNDPTIQVVLASGRPFESFQIGYLLKKEFGIKWIPDYRDEWNTHQSPAEDSLLWKYIRKKERAYEKLWTSNADHFISVSSLWVERIEKYIGVKGSTIMNGYDTIHDLSNRENNGSHSLEILYSGTVYPSQQIEVLVKVVKELAEMGEKINLTFIGTEIIPSQTVRLREITKGMNNVRFFDRLEKKALLEFQQKSDILFMTSFTDVKGWLPVKMFDYYSTGKPILVCPSDQDVIDEFIRETNSGVCCQNESDLKVQLLTWLAMKKEGKAIYFERDLVKGNVYSRQHQVKQLAVLLESLTQ